MYDFEPYEYWNLIDTGEFVLSGCQSHGLVGWWPLGLSSGTIDRDYSGYNNHSTRSGLVQIKSNRGFIGPVDVIDCDGSTSNGIAEHNDMLTMPVFTATFWVNIDQISETYPIILANTNTSQSRNFTVAINNADLGSIWWQLKDAGTPSTTSISPDLSLDTWYHFALAYDASYNLRLLIDGVEKATATGTAEPNQDAGAKIYMGGGASGFGNLDGMISDVRIYNRSLSDNEIRCIAREPWAMIEPIGRRVYGFISAAAPTVDYPPILRHHIAGTQAVP